MDVIERELCPGCGQLSPVPRDGRWRYAKSGKVHESMEVATQAADHLTKRNTGWEYRAVVDGEGKVRIASRRLPS